MTGLTLPQEIYIAAFSTAATIPVVKPLAYLKIVRQANNSKASFNPRVWYRGTTIFSCNLIPKTVIQVLFNRALSEQFPEASASLAGISSAPLICLTDSVLIQQQEMKKNLFKTVSYMYKTYGPRVFFRALPATVIRELSFTTALLSMAPKIEEKIKKRGYTDLEAKVGGGILAGTFAATVSQVFDTRKTRIQTYLDHPTSNWRNLFTKEASAGYTLRVLALSASIFIYNFVRTALAAKPCLNAPDSMLKQGLEQSES
jgi:hypothetical protein